MRCDASSCLSPSLISAVYANMNLLPQKGMQLELGLPVHHASNADYGVCTAQSIDRDHALHHVSKPPRKGADNASFVIRGRRRMNSARPVFRHAKAHWLPPVNRVLAWSEVFSPSTSMPSRTATGASTCRPVVMDADCISVAGQFRPSLPLLPANLMFASLRKPWRSHSVGRDWVRSGFGCKGFRLQERR
jgi:hypothetical protein